MTDDGKDLLSWRNLVADWHLQKGMPDCGCDDDTDDGDFCRPSVEWADARFADRDDPALLGPEDRWNHAVWVAAWGRNAPMIAEPIEFRLPGPPEGLLWLVRRIMVGGRCAVELVLYPKGDHCLSAVVSRARVEAEPSTVLARAGAMVSRWMSL